MSHASSSYLFIHGIFHHTTCFSNPEQNGITKRKNRHLLEITRALLFHLHVPRFFKLIPFKLLRT